jgi:hypothetical protein
VSHTVLHYLWCGVLCVQNAISGRSIWLCVRTGISFLFCIPLTGAYLEHICCDPKDGELYLIRLKSGETLMEDRNSSDVQIDCQNWV